MVSPLEALAGSLGAGLVAPPERLKDYCVDGIVPEAVITPPHGEAVSELLSLASVEGKSVTPWGGGTQMALGNSPRTVDLVLGLGRLDRVLFHEPSDLVARVEAGITLKALQEELSRQGQFLPLEAPFPSRATIGGMLSANASGPSRLGYGTCRDWLIGVKVAHSNGTVTRAGGRVVKNVAGYDLNKLYTGSLGTLGIILEATFKLAPVPAERRTLVATCPSLATAFDAAQGLLRQGFTPHALQVVSREVMGRLPGTGVFGDGKAAVLALFDGPTSAVRRKLYESHRLLIGGGATALEQLSREEGADLWQAITDLGWEREEGPYVALKVSTVPSRTPEVAESIGWPEGGMADPGLVADVGFGLVRLLWWASEGQPATPSNIGQIIAAARRGEERHVVVERCPVEVKRNVDVWGDSLEGIDIMRRIKQELDPTGTLNPGRFAGGI